MVKDSKARFSGAPDGIMASTFMILGGVCGELNRNGKNTNHEFKTRCYLLETDNVAS
jgi:hypothetical protein